LLEVGFMFDKVKLKILKKFFEKTYP